jgi:hypothetical protein
LRIKFNPVIHWAACVLMEREREREMKKEERDEERREREI